MNVTIKQLRAVVSLASTASFRSAAEATHVSPPALSIAIAQLEGELGVRLFDRTSRQVSVSEIGARFIENARRVLADVDNMLQDVGDAAAARKGVVTIASVASIAGRVLPLALQRIAESFPGIEVRLVDDVGNQVISAVRERNADFGLTTAPEFATDDMICEPLHQDAFYLAFHKDHRLARKRVINWSDIQGERVIGLSDATASFSLVDRELRKQTIQSASTFTVSQLSVAHALLDAAFGICVLPEIALPPPTQPHVVAALLRRPRLWRSIVACRLRNRSLSPAAEAALRIVRELFHEHPWQR